MGILFLLLPIYALSDREVAINSDYTALQDSEVFLVGMKSPITEKSLIAETLLPVIPTGSYRELIATYDWDANIAYAVMMAESHGDPTAFNPEWHYTRSGKPICQGSYSLFQVACIHAPIGQLKDPISNIKVAYRVYKESSWGAWTTFVDGKYLKYLWTTLP